MPCQSRTRGECSYRNCGKIFDCHGDGFSHPAHGTPSKWFKVLLVLALPPLLRFFSRHRNNFNVGEFLVGASQNSEASHADITN
jgi:hypothetical protein